MGTYLVAIHINFFYVKLFCRKKAEGIDVKLGTWTPDDKMKLEPGKEGFSLPRLFRIGMVPSAPWMFFKKDPETGKELLDEDGNKIPDGYCVELLREIAKKLNFEYEIILSSDYMRSGFEYGRKNITTGKWSGLIGDLASGDVDIGKKTM